jgi:hypothetical protein
MPMLAIAAILLLARQAQDTIHRAIPADSYADSATADLVHRARAARERNERLVTAYQAKVSERIGVGLRAFSRDRMLYRQETVSRISWRRDSTSTIEVVGAREGVPVAEKGDRLPEDLRSDVRALVINPAEDYLRVLGSRGEEGFIYPLRQGGEADYRFRIGDSTIIALPTGQRVRLIALDVSPRRADFRLMSGTLWFDLESYALVRAVFRPARPYSMRRDADPEDMKDVPSFINAGAEVRYVTLEYGFYENRWWMPRYMGIDAVGTMGSWLNVPVRIERVYDDYQVEGGSAPAPNSDFRPAGTIRRYRTPDGQPLDSAARRHLADSISAAVQDCIAREVAHQDSVNPGHKFRVGIARGLCRREPSDSVLTVVIPRDTAALLTSPELGPPILDMGDLVTEEELRPLQDAIGALPPRPWEHRVELPSGVGALLRNARYNRVEALSLGLKGSLDFGRARLDGLVRMGAADLVPNGELTLQHLGAGSHYGFTAYRRLTAANPDVKPFGPVNSILGILAQRDDGEYFRTLGVEFSAGSIASGWWNVRFFAERQRSADVETQASLPHFLNGDRRFRSNIIADPADEAGASLQWRGSHTYSRSVTATATLTTDGAIGDFDFLRMTGSARAVFTPAGLWGASLTLAGGSSTGDVPIQSRYYLGGAGSLRGYAGGVVSGPAFWSGRFEVARGQPAVRLVAFSDVGWAGSTHTSFWKSRPLIGAGIGASFLDGLVRIDLARGLRDPKGWRMELYFDGGM